MQQARSGAPARRTRETSGPAVLVSPDLGAEKRIKAYAAALQLPLVVCNKTRNYAVANTVERVEVFKPSR